MSFRRFILNIGLVSFIFSACEAPHDNPYDPVNGRIPLRGEIFGFVSRYYPPYIGMPQVTVLISPLLRMALTDAAGNYHFVDVPPGDYELFFSRPGFAPDSTAIQLAPFQKANVNMRLNALPKCYDSRIFSQHLSDWGFINDIDQYELHFRTRALDADGDRDIDSVFVLIEDLNFKRALLFDLHTAEYYLILPEARLPNRSIESILGKRITLIARDKVGFEQEVQAPFLIRIIESTPIALSPRGLQIVSKTPILRWQKSVLKYHHTLKLEIYYYTDLRRTLAIPAWQMENLAADQDSLQINNALIAGNYFWVLMLVDEFGNSSRSKKAEFEVQ